MEEPTPEQQEDWNLSQIRQRKSRLQAKPIGSVIRRLLASTGYGDTQAAEQLLEHWNAAVGPTLAKLTRPGNVTRGSLQVFVANSSVMQELHFRKKQILMSLRSAASAQISDLRIRVSRFDADEET